MRRVARLATSAQHQTLKLLNKCGSPFAARSQSDLMHSYDHIACIISLLIMLAQSFHHAEHVRIHVGSTHR